VTRRELIFLAVLAVGIASVWMWGAYSPDRTPAAAAEASAAYYPEDAVAYASLSLDPAGGQLEYMTEVVEFFHEFEAVGEWVTHAETLLVDAMGTDLEGIGAWIGSELSAAIFDLGDGGPGLALAIDVTDQAAAGEFLARWIERREQGHAEDASVAVGVERLGEPVVVGTQAGEAELVAAALLEVLVGDAGDVGEEGVGVDVVAVHSLQALGGDVGLAGNLLPALGLGVARGHGSGHAGDLVVGETGELAADEPVLGAVGKLGDVGNVVAEAGGGDIRRRRSIEGVGGGMEMSEFPFSVLALIDLGPTARLPLEPSLGVIRHQILGSDPPDVAAEFDLDIVG